MSIIRRICWITAVLAACTLVSTLTTLLIWDALPAKTIVEEHYNVQNVTPKVEQIMVVGGNSTPTLESRVEAAIAKVKPSLVNIRVVSQKGSLLQPQVRFSGSGFIVTPDGSILTNAHVVDKNKTVTVLTDDGGVYNGTVVGADVDTDLAVIKINAEKPLTPVEFGDSDNLTLGQFVIAMGSPYRLTNSVTVGVVSGLNRTLQTETDSDIYNIIQTDAAINPGNSGGPLVDLDGRVIGINSALISQSGGFEGIGFSIPINTAKNISAELMLNGKVIRPWMGVTIRDVNVEVQKTFNITTKEGVLILDIIKDSPAYKAGLHGTLIKKDYSEVVTGDIITSANGIQVTTIEDLLNVLHGLKPGQEMNVTYYRDNNQRKATITLGERP